MTSSLAARRTAGCDVIATMTTVTSAGLDHRGAAIAGLGRMATDWTDRAAGDRPAKTERRRPRRASQLNRCYARINSTAIVAEWTTAPGRMAPPRDWHEPPPQPLLPLPLLLVIPRGLMLFQSCLYCQNATSQHDHIGGSTLRQSCAIAQRRFAAVNCPGILLGKTKLGAKNGGDSEVRRAETRGEVLMKGQQPLSSAS